MTKRIKEALTNLLTKWLEDIFMLAGTAVIVATTYGINETAGNYLLGFIFLGVGFLLAKK